MQAPPEPSLSPTALAFLQQAGLPYRLHAHAPVVSFEDARALLPFDAGAMVKCLAFRLPDGRYLLAALRGQDRADYKRIADAFGVRRADLRLAADEELATDLQMVPGGVAPLPVGGARVIVDEAAARLVTLYCGTGRNDSTLEIETAALLRATGAGIAPLAKP